MSIKHPLASAPRPGNEFATLGGGCFWCLEAVYEELEGVVDGESGYSGGQVRQPSYRAVCGGDTGHAEVVRIEFDPARLSYSEVLEAFFAIHDPTTRNRQGNDIGSQYRSVIFHHSESQRQTAEEVIAEAQPHYELPMSPSGWPQPIRPARTGARRASTRNTFATTRSRAIACSSWRRKLPSFARRLRRNDGKPPGINRFPRCHGHNGPLPSGAGSH